MNTAVNDMAVSFGKLGLTTDAATIDARGKGLVAAATKFGSGEVSDILSCALEANGSDDLFPFLEQFREHDPTFDVRMKDKEASLLAASLLSYEIQSETGLGEKLALVLTTTLFGGLRKIGSDPGLAKLAEKYLTIYQSVSAKAPSRMAAVKIPKTFTEALDAFPANGPVDAAQLRTMLIEIQKQLESRAQSNFTAVNNSLDYVNGLEEELRTHFWVVNGWSDTTRTRFGDIELLSAAIIAGGELASKTTKPYGIFAAPSLLDNMLKVDRKDFDRKVTLADAAKALALEERTERFTEVAQSRNAPLVPLVTAMGLAAISEDQADWGARYKREIKINPTTKLTALDVAVQFYRESLVLGLLT